MDTKIGVASSEESCSSANASAFSTYSIIIYIDAKIKVLCEGFKAVGNLFMLAQQKVNGGATHDMERVRC